MKHQRCNASGRSMKAYNHVAAVARKQAADNMHEQQLAAMKASRQHMSESMQGADA